MFIIWDKKSNLKDILELFIRASLKYFDLVFYYFEILFILFMYCKSALHNNSLQQKNITSLVTRNFWSKNNDFLLLPTIHCHISKYMFGLVVSVSPLKCFVRYITFSCKKKKLFICFIYVFKYVRFYVTRQMKSYSYIPVAAVKSVYKTQHRFIYIQRDDVHSSGDKTPLLL